MSGVLLAAAAGTMILLGQVRKPEAPAWETFSTGDSGDTITVVLHWELENDGRGPADSFTVFFWASNGATGPETSRHVVPSAPDSFVVPAPASSQKLDLTFTVQAFRKQQISRPVASSWRYPSDSGTPGFREDPQDPDRILLTLPTVSFHATSSAQRAPGRRDSNPPPRRDTTRAAPPPAPSQPPVASAAGSQCSNEPPGFSPLTGEGWGEVPRRGNERVNDRWVAESRPERFSQVEDPTAPSGGRVIEGKFPQGHPGGRGPFKMVRRFPRDLNAVYMCAVVKLSDNFTNNGNTGTKFGFLLTPYQEGKDRLNHYFNLANRLGVNLQSGGGTLNRNMPSQFNMLQHRGQWVRIEWLIVANRKGMSDGVARIWANNRLVLNTSNVQYFFPNQEPSFKGVTWNPTYGGGSNPVPEDMYQRISYWYISGR